MSRCYDVSVVKRFGRAVTTTGTGWRAADRGVASLARA